MPWILRLIYIEERVRVHVRHPTPPPCPCRRSRGRRTARCRRKWTPLQGRICAGGDDSLPRDGRVTAVSQCRLHRGTPQWQHLKQEDLYHFIHYHAEHHAGSHLYTAWRPEYVQTHTGLVSEEDLAVYGVQRGNQQVAAPLLVQDPV